MLSFYTINILTCKYRYRVYGRGPYFSQSKSIPPECILLEVWKNGGLRVSIWVSGVWVNGKVLVGLWGWNEWSYFDGNSIVLLVVVKCVGVMGVRGVRLDWSGVLLVWLFCVLWVYWLCIRVYIECIIGDVWGVIGGIKGWLIGDCGEFIRGWVIVVILGW